MLRARERNVPGGITYLGFVVFPSAAARISVDGSSGGATQVRMGGGRASQERHGMGRGCVLEPICSHSPSPVHVCVPSP